MKKWEYCAVGPISGSITSEFSWETVKPRFIRFDPQESTDKRIEGEKERRALADGIAKLGDNGWEMVGCGPIHDGGSHYLYFKRELIR